MQKNQKYFPTQACRKVTLDRGVHECLEITGSRGQAAGRRHRRKSRIKSCGIEYIPIGSEDTGFGLERELPCLACSKIALNYK